MSDYKDVVSLTDDLPESSYSGLSDLPEVKDPEGWLLGTTTRSGFRSILLDDVIPVRKETPEWATTIEEKTTGQKVIEKTGILSEGIVGGEADKLNKVGETFYSIKDGLANFFESTPRYVADVIGAYGKTFGVSEEASTELLKKSLELKRQSDFNRALRNFRLGVEPDAFSNELFFTIGNMLGITATAYVTGGASGTAGGVAGVLEGVQEGGSYLETDLEAQSQRPGGLEAYKGEGLGFATTHGVLSGLIGRKGAEAIFLDDLSKKTGTTLGKSVAKSMKHEFYEELIQEGEGRAARRAQNEVYGTTTDYQTYLEDILGAGKAALMGALGGAPFGGLGFVANRNYMAEQLQEKFGLTKEDAKQLAGQYLENTATAFQRNGNAMKDLAPESRVMQISKQTLMSDGMDEKQADKTLASIRKSIIKEQIKKGEELADNDFFKIADNLEELNSYVRNKAGVQSIADIVVEEKKQEIAEKRAELEQKAQTETAQETEEKPSEPMQLEFNFLNARENAINEAMNIDVPALPVQQDLITPQQAEEIKTEVQTLQAQVDEITETNTPQQAQIAEVGKELNSFTKPETAESKYATRVAKQTGVKDIDMTHRVRDIKSAKQAADDLVASDENAAWEILENDRADTRGLLRSEVAEALKRKIATTQDIETRKSQLRRLITAYSSTTTRIGQEMRALADDSLVDAIRDVVRIENNVKQKVQKAINIKANKVENVLDKITKSNRVMSDKKFWEEMKEALECR